MKPLSGDTLLANVKAHLEWDSRVDTSRIRIDVTDENVVNLNGAVSTIFESRAAEDDAWSVWGVSFVNNQLSVSYPDTIAIPADSELKKNIEETLTWSLGSSGATVNVGVECGVVRLQGAVKTYSIRDRIEQMVYDMAGVKKILDEITVMPPAAPSDAQILHDISSALDRSLEPPRAGIRVEVDKGQVMLAGTVRSRISYHQAYTVAANTTGVVAIINNIKIQP